MNDDKPRHHWTQWKLRWMDPDKSSIELGMDTITITENNVKEKHEVGMNIRCQI